MHRQTISVLENGRTKLPREPHIKILEIRATVSA